MSTKASFWLRGKKGQLAGTTVYQSKGRTIQREIVPVSNPQTRAQMEQRVKWPNLVNTYKLLKSIMKYAFENKKGAQSDYNALMSVNASAPVVPAITKSEARMGIVIPAPYTITRGSLPTLTGLNTYSSGHVATNLACEDFEIESDTNLRAFVRALLEQNPALREGMQISIIVVSAVVSDNGEVTSSMQAFEFLLDSNSAEELSKYVPFGLLTTDNGFVSIDPSAVAPEGAGSAVAIILSETISGKTRVSSEKFVLDGEGYQVYDKYTSASAINAAINSYGVQENAFLSSAEANKA